MKNRTTPLFTRNFIISAFSQFVNLMKGISLLILSFSLSKATLKPGKTRKRAVVLLWMIMDDNGWLWMEYEVPLQVLVLHIYIAEPGHVIFPGRVHP